MKDFEHIIMKDLSYDGTPLKDMNLIEFDSFNQYRLYFKPEIEGSGFKFAVIEWISNPSDEPMWGDNAQVQFLFNGHAYFDGVRHLYLNTTKDEIFDYINYPNIDDLIKILQKIRELEITYCRGG